MSFELLGDIDWLAVILAALAYFVIGAIAIYAVPLVGGVLSAIALEMIAFGTGTDTIGEGVVLGLVVGIGFAVSIALVTATFESTKP